MIIRHELFTVPQMERPDRLRETVVEWLDSLEPNQALLVGLPAVLGNWEACTPLVMPGTYQVEFLTWIDANRDAVRGPVYNLPALTASFLCVVLTEDHDLEEPLPEDAGEELRGTFTAFRKQQEESLAA